MEKRGRSCTEPARGPLAAAAPTEAGEASTPDSKEVDMAVQVGKPAPDFEANAYVDGTFGVVKLSDYKGKWVVLCFYPGDFTFV